MSFNTNHNESNHDKSKHDESNHNESNHNESIRKHKEFVRKHNEFVKADNFMEALGKMYKKDTNIDNERQWFYPAPLEYVHDSFYGGLGIETEPLKPRMACAGGLSDRGRTALDNAKKFVENNIAPVTHTDSDSIYIDDKELDYDELD